MTFVIGIYLENVVKEIQLYTCSKKQGWVPTSLIGINKLITIELKTLLESKKQKALYLKYHLI